jgi:hypothetical protein
MNWKVPFFDLQLGAEEQDAVRAALDSDGIVGYCPLVTPSGDRARRWTA